MKKEKFKIRNIVLLLIFTSILLIALLYGIEKSKQSNNIRTVYEISSPEDLLAFSDSVNQGNEYIGKQVILTRDIDMSGISDFIPIGIYESNHYFYGIFNGKGHTISNLVIDYSEGYANNGLFGSLGGTVCNLNFDNCHVYGNASGIICSIAASNESRIYNCHIKNSESHAQYTDGFCGQYLGRYANCVWNNEILFSSGNTLYSQTISNSNLCSETDSDIVLNSNLPYISQELHHLPLCKWKTTNGVLELTCEESSIPEVSISLSNSSLKSKIYAHYNPIDDQYIMVLPYWNQNLMINLDIKSDDEDKCSRIIDASELELGLNTFSIENGGKNYSVGLICTENAPSMIINTTEEYGMDYILRNKERRVPGYMSLISSTGKSLYKGQLKYLKGHGNNSWKTAAKKSFNIKLDNSADLLDMGLAEKYVLLSGYRDNSLLSTAVTMQLEQNMNDEYAPEFRYVNLFVDGYYLGLFLLTERFEIAPSRINIMEGQDITGGYLFESNNATYEGKPNIVTNTDNHYVILSDNIPSQEQLDYATELWNEFEEAIYSNDGYNSLGKHYTEYMDIDSLARMWLYLEFMAEDSLHGSVFFYKESDNIGDGKIHALYPWDVEHSYVKKEFVSSPFVEIETGFEAHGLWPAMYAHQDFREAVYGCWENGFKQACVDIVTEKNDENSPLDNLYEPYISSFYANEMIWGESQNVISKSEEINGWIEQRIPFLDSYLKESIIR